MKIKKVLALLLIACMLFALCSCGKKEEKADAHLNVAVSFAYQALDPHLDYCGWNTSMYGICESLFKIDASSTAKPFLLEKAENDGTKWTLTLKDGVKFSNGNKLTADMVRRNLLRAAEVNNRFEYLAGFNYEVVDEKTLVVDTRELLPTLPSDLASPELGMIDLDSTTDFVNNPICTGPFVPVAFTPTGDCEVKRNENYWGGKVTLEGAKFFYLADDESKLYAMQNGEIDVYNSVSAAAREVYSQDPDTYKLVTIPATRLQFYCLNENRLDDSLRRAITLIIDKDNLAEFQNGTVSTTDGPFSRNAAYGKVNVPKTDVAAAKELLEKDGYKLNGDGYYEKDGKVLELKICYYQARQLPTIATALDDQFRKAGIKTVLQSEEDPDATYVKTGDFDIALYCMIADKAGDPYFGLDAMFRQSSKWAIGGFKSDEVETLLDELKVETDTAKRAELANKIVQLVVDEDAFGFLGLFTKTTVLRKGVSGYAENIPFDFYGLEATSTKE
ncbi:MAG: ABC transporter substrate-binding protein [Firmicutes bacterium]|nr:ABC transporter substrate-binding protein [Bacillota bacterium]